MNKEQKASNIPDHFAEAQLLLEGRSWEAGHALWVQGETIVIFFNPSAHATQDRFDVPVTLRVLNGSADLEGAQLVLEGVGPHEEVKTYKERLNKHGLALFRGVERGSYRPALVPQESLIQSGYRAALGVLKDLKRSVADISFNWQVGGVSGAAFAADRPNERKQTYSNSEGSLKATLEPDAGNMLLRIHTTDERWVPGFVPFSWIAISDQEDSTAELVDVLIDRQASTADRTMAASKLGDIGNEDVVSVFRQVVNDCDSDVREAVTRALASFEIRTRFFTVLAWDNLLSEYVAELNLGPEPKRYQLGLPDKPLSPEALSPSMIPMLGKSIKCALTKNHDLLAWRQILRSNDIHPRIRTLIEEETHHALID